MHGRCGILLSQAVIVLNWDLVVSVDGPGICGGGAIAGIIVGALAAAWICGGAFFCFIRRKCYVSKRRISSRRTRETK